MIALPKIPSDLAVSSVSRHPLTPEKIRRIVRQGTADKVYLALIFFCVICTRAMLRDFFKMLYKLNFKLAINLFHLLVTN